jgi:FdhE protein
MSGSPEKWDKRIRRATELAATHPFAAEALRFYERIATFQKSLYADLEAAGGMATGTRAPGSLRDRLDLRSLLPRFGSFLSLVAEVAPLPLARSAAALHAEGEERWRGALGDFLRPGGQGPETLAPVEALLAWTFLQPCAEQLADELGPVETQGAPPLCPRCASRPQVGVLRQQGDGAKRSLLCSLCATEWEFRRLVCPACGEEGVDKLPVYLAEELGHVRVEACDSCHHFIKTIDLTKDGRAVPVVDELAAIPLSLWASENGYTKWSPNLLGL